MPYMHNFVNEASAWVVPVGQCVSGSAGTHRTTQHYLKFVLTEVPEICRTWQLCLSNSQIQIKRESLKYKFGK